MGQAKAPLEPAVKLLCVRIGVWVCFALSAALNLLISYPFATSVILLISIQYNEIKKYTFISKKYIFYVWP